MDEWTDYVGYLAAGIQVLVRYGEGIDDSWHPDIEVWLAFSDVRQQQGKGMLYPLSVVGTYLGGIEGEAVEGLSKVDDTLLDWLTREAYPGHLADTLLVEIRPRLAEWIEEVRASRTGMSGAVRR